MQIQPLATVALSTTNWFDGTNKSSTMSWLEQVKVVAERKNKAPLGMAKLKGAPLHSVHKICDLSWWQLWKLLIENYSDTPYVSDAMVEYNKILQAEDKSFSQYLICAKDYLEQINHTSRLASMDSSGLNHISLSTGFEWQLHQAEGFQGCRGLEDHGWCFWLHCEDSEKCRENKSIQRTQVWETHWYPCYIQQF